MNRRSFLKILGFATGAVALGRLLPAAPPTEVGQFLGCKIITTTETPQWYGSWLGYSDTITYQDFVNAVAALEAQDVPAPYVILMPEDLYQEWLYETQRGWLTDAALHSQAQAPWDPPRQGRRSDNGLQAVGQVCEVPGYGQVIAAPRVHRNLDLSGLWNG